MTDGPIERIFDGVEWTPLPDPEPLDDGLPVATHEGVLDFGGLSLRCYTLDDGRRIFDAADVAALFEGAA